MKLSGFFSRIKESRGICTVEMALVLPLLLVLVFGVVEFSRAVQAKNILVNMSREGANLSARSFRPLQDIRQEVMDSIGLTANPLDMTQDGNIYITKLVGVSGGAAQVDEQYRWSQGQASVGDGSKIYSCPSWSADNCQVAENARGNVAGLVLEEGEEVYAVEVYYNYKPITNYVMKSDILLYETTFL